MGIVENRLSELRSARKGARHRRSAPTLEWPRLVQSSTRSHTAIRCSCLQWLPPLRKPVQTLFRVNLGRLHRLPQRRDRKSTRLNSSHQIISYAVFCWEKKTDAT